MFKNLSINLKLPLTIGFITFLVMAIIYLMLSSTLQRTSIDNVTRNAQLSAASSAYSLAEVVNTASNTARAFAATSANIIESGMIPAEHIRAAVLSELKALLAGDKRISNMWVIFEPNALDGRDNYFVGDTAMGSTSSGVFAPWIVDNVVHALEEEDGMMFFNAAKSAMREVLTEPYSYELQGQTYHMVSLCIPIFVNKRFVGVAGTDFFAHELLDKIKTFDDNATGRLVTDKGIIAISSNLEEISTNIVDNQHDISDGLAEGILFDGMFEDDGEVYYKVFIPVQLGENANLWFYTKSTPQAEIYAQANATEKLLIIYCLF